ncbi:hypothetical protein GDO86_011676 [Hymenochirus boettgeri]|uniref:Dendritic cell-specific transmembrane protein-like domain-containing protein n=1 Tax=Hymenochirus boettgeri TaxID=247094 RepID=A0A8T2JH56_9PIPI|nr:hypothetical protein GDO86_011676 [Hymenochirus boettgeri]
MDNKMTEKQRLDKPKIRNSKKNNRPNTTLKFLMQRFLPVFIYRVLSSDVKEYCLAKVFLGAGFGLILSIGIYFLLIEELPLNRQIKDGIFFAFVGTFTLGWVTSTYFRCTSIMIFTYILEKRWNAFAAFLAVGAITSGPVANVKDNLGEVVTCFGCTAEMTVNHTKMIFNSMMEPVKTVFKRLAQNVKNIGKNSKNLTGAFDGVKDQVVGTSGYDTKKEKEQEKEEIKLNNGKPLNTQKKFKLKTLLRCEKIFEKGVSACHDWFDDKHADCMRILVVPVFADLFCLPMKLKFICGIQYLMLPFCHKHMPIDEKFGEVFDDMNEGISELKQNISMELIIKHQDTVLANISLGSSQKGLKDDVKEDIKQENSQFQVLIGIVNTCKSFLFLLFFLSAFGYINKYNSDIRHDNLYITRYFRQIDARRRKMGKIYLLPLKKGERNEVIFPLKLAFQAPEFKPVAMVLLKNGMFIIALLLICYLDYVMYHLITIVTRHALITHTFSVCLPTPKFMTASEYIWLFVIMAWLLVAPIVQSYLNRIRRVVAAFYFPKMEKRRVLHLYNEWLRRRKDFLNIKRKSIIINARKRRSFINSWPGKLFEKFKWLRLFDKRHCVVCNDKETKESYICKTPDCETVYCQICWKDVKRCCVACLPYDEFG